ncbi:MAG: glutamine amidotransferase [Cognatishimia sp.]|uniref:glutamine amidotransferase n=1 Tax=Cognatishimia sp. TaxID=2211648 RepID=UPI004057E639
MSNSLLFDPLIDPSILAVLAAIMLATVGFALWRGLRGWALRGLGALAILLALAGPVLQREDRAPLSDIVLLVEDETASQSLGARGAQTETAVETLAARLEGRKNTEVRRVTLGDGADDSGTALISAVTEALSREPSARVAGVIAVTDGIVHDAEDAPAFPAPFHVVQTGQATDWDRRITVKNAPAFGILGEPIVLTLRVDDLGVAPSADTAPLQVSVDGAPPLDFTMPIGRDLEVPITLGHGGRNVLQFTIPTAEGELTDRNNTALIQINGVRDRLRVLLVSGEPHTGSRTWRNLLKSDSSVDLVHFTILRPPSKQDGVPVDELSLIAFPTRELFLQKIEDFDLIIFDRYQRRGILPSSYLENVVRYIEQGGAVLIAAGPDFASADSIYRSPLARILPAEPTARVVEEGFVPQISDLGARHPVTSGLPDEGTWGRWLRLVEVTPDGGQVVMTGAGDRPLLVLDRKGEGRVAMLASDQAWLWARGYEGGGPQLELLRRLAHWMMGEPELEEEALWAEANGQRMRIIRQSLQSDVGAVTVQTPSGETRDLELTETAPGRFEALYEGAEIGLYRLTNEDQEAVIGLGPAAPREFTDVIASAASLQPTVDQLRGGVFRIEEGLPSIRNTRMGRPASGTGWLGLVPRDAYQVQSVSRTALMPAWLVLLMVSAMIIGGWLREGRG